MEQCSALLGEDWFAEGYLYFVDLDAHRNPRRGASIAEYAPH